MKRASVIVGIVAVVFSLIPCCYLFMVGGTLGLAGFFMSYIVMQEARRARTPVPRLGLWLNAAAIVIAFLWVIGAVGVLAVTKQEVPQGGPFFPGGW